MFFQNLGFINDESYKIEITNNFQKDLIVWDLGSKPDLGEIF